MTLLRPVSLVDATFILGVFLLTFAALGYWRKHRSEARLVGILGWSVFTVFWFVTSAKYLVESRYFLGSIGFVTVLVAFYATSLVFREKKPGVELTVAFAVMGVLFIPFEFIEPVHGFVLNTVAAHTAWGLSVAGYSPVIGHNAQGYANVILFEGMPLSHSVQIVSACSGISGVVVFVGFIAATDASRKRKVVFSLGIIGLIYLLNIVRAMFVAGALGGEWFGFAEGTVGAMYGVSDPALVSYYVAEYFVSQVLVILVLLGVYLQVSSRLPELSELISTVLDTALDDFNELAERTSSE